MRRKSLRPALLLRLTGTSGRFLDYLKTHPKVTQAWGEYTKHEFVARLGQGTLAQDEYVYYLKQDYIFLVSLRRPAITYLC